MQLSPPSGQVIPLPPANSISESVKAFNKILEQLGGEEALQAHKAGSGLARVNLVLWAAAWEGARSFRDHFLLTLARHTREEWRRDCRQIVEKQPKFNHEKHFKLAMQARLEITFNFAFTLLTPRHVCLLTDALMLAFEAEVPPPEFSRELGLAVRGLKGSDAHIDAVVMGGSGMFRYEPERLLSSPKNPTTGYGS
jgi:hypothetical protein